MNRKYLIWGMIAVIVIPTLIGIGYWLYWDMFAKYQPNPIKREQQTVQTLLDRSGAVSSGGQGAKLYVITHRSCKECRVYETEELPKFQSVGVDTRIIVFAPADDQGLSKSTQIERSTVAEIWWSRNNALYQKWFATPDSLWTASDLTVADNDLARSAVVNAGRTFAKELNDALRANNIRAAYPLVIWRDKTNALKVCVCTDERSFKAVRQDLGAPDSLAIENKEQGFDFPSLDEAEKNLKSLPKFDWTRLDPRTWFAPKKDELAKSADVVTLESDQDFAKDQSYSDAASQSSAKSKTKTPADPGPYDAEPVYGPE